MARRRRDFETAENNGSADYWYDIREDWDLIEASFAAQYGIRLRCEPEMSWDEFCALLAGITEDTPLGQIVRIRSEQDREIVRRFSPAQREIRRKWQMRRARQLQQTGGVEIGQQMDMLIGTLRSAFGEGA